MMNYPTSNDCWCEEESGNVKKISIKYDYSIQKHYSDIYGNKIILHFEWI